jgi:hypothetical protein
MNRDGIKMAWKIDRKTASARSLQKKTLHGVKDRVASCKAAGIPAAVELLWSCYFILRSAGQPHCYRMLGTVFAPALTQFPVMPELPNLGTSQTRIRYNAFLPYSMSHLVFPLIYPFGQGRAV